MANVDAPVTYEVSVSEDLQALLGGRAPFASASVNPTGIDQCRPHRASETTLFASTKVEPRPMRLRRDGSRPVCFEGLEVFRICVGETEEQADGKAGHMGRQSFAVFLSRGEACIGQLSVVPPATLPARPLYRARPVRNAEDIRALVQEGRPEMVLLDRPPSTGFLGIQVDALARLHCQSDQLMAATSELVRDAA